MIDIICQNKSFYPIGSITSISMDGLTLQQLKESNFHSPVITDVILDHKKVIEIISEWVSIAEKGFDTLWDVNMFNFLWKYGKDGIYQAKKLIEEKDIKIRMITETTKDNIESITSINCPNMRHLEGIKGNFGIFDQRAYMVFIFHKNHELPDQTLWNNSKSLVSQQQILFNKLWEISVPFSSRKYELENLENPFQKKRIFTDYKTIQREIELIMDQPAKELLIFSSVNLFQQFIDKDNIIEAINTLLKKGVRMKILLDDFSLGILDQINKINKTHSSIDHIQTAYTNRLGNFNELIIIGDQKSVMQINYDPLSKLFASISNEEHQILLQDVLFEKYWNEVMDITI